MLRVKVTVDDEKVQFAFGDGIEFCRDRPDTYKEAMAFGKVRVLRCDTRQGPIFWAYWNGESCKSFEASVRRIKGVEVT